MADKSSRRTVSNGQHKTVKSKPAAQKKPAAKSPVVKSTLKTAPKLASDQISLAQEAVQKATEKAQKAIVTDAQKLASPLDPKQWFPGDLPESEALGALPEVFRVLAEQGLAQTKTAYEATKDSLEKASDTFGSFVHHASNTINSIQIKTMDMAALNMTHYFEYARALVTVRNLSEAFEVQNIHMTKQVDLVSSQMKEWQDFSQDILANSAHQLQGQTDR